MAVKCGVCGNKERFSSSADLKLELTVDCDGRVICHDLDRILSELSLQPQACAECKSRKLVESEYISDHEWDAQITQALKQRDVLLKVLPEMIVSNSQMTILALQQSGQQVTEENRKQLQSQLNFARKHAVTDEQLQKIESLLNILK